MSFFMMNGWERTFVGVWEEYRPKISPSFLMLEIFFFVSIATAECHLILETIQDCRLHAHAASSTYCRQFGASGLAQRDCQGKVRG
jgi:hypothetical protein